MILHLVTKHLVSNICLSVFEKRAQGQNIILVLNSLSCWDSVPFVNNAIEVSEDNEKDVVASLDFSQITHVVMHYLTSKTAVFIQKYIPQGIPIYWWTYGGDLYSPYLQRRGYDVYYTDLTPFRYGWTYMVKRYSKTLINRIMFRFGVFYDNRYMQTALMDRIAGVIPCIPPDHEMACKYIKKDFKLVRVHPVDCPPFDEEFHTGNVVAIGHSASVTGNHLYALKYMSSIDIKDSCISLTLSYNINNRDYLKIVKERYKRKFKNKVRFIEERLSKDEYYKSQNDIKILIIACWRQEALSNVFSCLLRGVKVFLSKRGPMYDHFINYGFKIFAIEDLNQEEFDTPLKLDEKQYNRNLMLNYLSEQEKRIDEDFKLYFDGYIVEN